MGVEKCPCKDMARKEGYLPFGASCQGKDLTPIDIPLKVWVWSSRKVTLGREMVLLVEQRIQLNVSVHVFMSKVTVS